MSDLVVSQLRCDISGIMLIYTDFLKATHRQFCFLCLKDKNAFRSADLAELNSDHEAVWDHVIGAPPYGRSEQNGIGITSSGYKLGRRKKIDGWYEETTD